MKTKRSIDDLLSLVLIVFALLSGSAFLLDVVHPFDSDAQAHARPA